jgi:hypothetical protein
MSMSRLFITFRKKLFLSVHDEFVVCMAGVLFFELFVAKFFNRFPPRKSADKIECFLSSRHSNFCTCQYHVASFYWLQKLTDGIILFYSIVRESLKKNHVTEKHPHPIGQGWPLYLFVCFRVDSSTCPPG